MKQEILLNIDNPKQLENLYRDNKSTFKKEFNLLYPEIATNKLAAFWNERLNGDSAESTGGSTKELGFVIIASLIAGLIAKLPEMLNISEELFYQRNIGFIVLPILAAFFIWKNKLSTKKIILPLIATLVAVVYINFLPINEKSDTLLLACIHLPLFLWVILGFSYSGNNIKDLSKRIDFLRFNGDLVVLTALLLISGGILTGVTIGLFEVIGFKIEKFYFSYIVAFGLPAIPIVATYVVQTNPQLINKVSPVIAKIFSPLVLIMLSVYLVAIFVSGKDPYNDREFLMIFNILLIGVMAIILFSVAETQKKNETRASSFILLALSIVTIIVNGIALSAILFRISEGGFTPNRLAVLGANILMLTNLLMVTFQLFKTVTNKSDIGKVENSIAVFLPIYSAWTVVVIFVFPFIFGFK